MTTHPHEITFADIPDHVRFDVPGRNQGQIIEVAYGTTSKGEASHRDPYMRVTDRTLEPSDPKRVRYFQRLMSTEERNERCTELGEACALIDDGGASIADVVEDYGPDLLTAARGLAADHNLDERVVLRALAECAELATSTTERALANWASALESAGSAGSRACAVTEYKWRVLDGTDGPGIFDEGDASAPHKPSERPPSPLVAPSPSAALDQVEAGARAVAAKLDDYTAGDMLTCVVSWDRGLEVRTITL